MAKIDSQLLFLTTSPRTPKKMIPEIELLITNFKGQKWNHDTQVSFMDILREENFFQGMGAKDPAFSARDRINRAPKSLGFINLQPVIALTPAGEHLLLAKRDDEVFLRQMLKFQIPSPYHRPSKKAAVFWVKPYLELLRLIRTFGTLKFDELQIFGMQLTDYHDFDLIVNKIEKYRIAKVKNKGNYKVFKAKYLNDELRLIYSDRILKGETKTRESSDNSLAYFLKTQSGNTRDYADACFRYLRATGLVSVSHVGKSLSIVKDRIDEVDYILENVNRDPVFVDDLLAYQTYLGDSSLPKLLTDDKSIIIHKLSKEFPEIQIDETASLDKLKDLLADMLHKRKQEAIDDQIIEIKDHKKYFDIQKIFEDIYNKSLYDAPLMLEWNTWRAMTMLDGGNIIANLCFDDYGNPMSTAAGNVSDIICDYGDFNLCVEVTMASGQRQYEMEGEPVARHLGKLKKSSNKPCYCLFLAPQINESCIAHFYTLYHLNIPYYGGKSTIVPLPLKVFQKMLEDSYKATYTPSPHQVRSLFEASDKLALNCNDAIEWYEQLLNHALHWLE